MKTKLALAATAALLLSGAAASVSVAQQTQSNDGTKGGREITIDRVLEGAQNMFATLDTNADGVLSQAEIDTKPQRGERGENAEGRQAKKGKGKKAGRMMKAFIGADGLTSGMTWNDLQTKVASAFTGIDADGSGSLTREELAPLRDAMKAERQARKSANS